MTRLSHLLLDRNDVTFEPPAEPMGSDQWRQAYGIAHTIMAICGNRTVTLHRAALIVTGDDGPLTITGQVLGTSTTGEGQIRLLIEVADGTVYSVDVTDPAEWNWEVGR